MTDAQKFIDQPLSAHIANVGTREQLEQVQKDALPVIDKFMRELLPGFGFIVITSTPQRPDGKGQIVMTKNMSLGDAVGMLAYQIQVHARGLFYDVEVKK